MATEQTIDRLQQWALDFSGNLKARAWSPTPFADGVRVCKAEVAAILAAEHRASADEVADLKRELAETQSRLMECQGRLEVMTRDRDNLLRTLRGE